MLSSFKSIVLANLTLDYFNKSGVPHGGWNEFANSKDCVFCFLYECATFKKEYVLQQYLQGINNKTRITTKH